MAVGQSPKDRAAEPPNHLRTGKLSLATDVGDVLCREPGSSNGWISIVAVYHLLAFVWVAPISKALDRRTRSATGCRSRIGPLVLREDWTLPLRGLPLLSYTKYQRTRCNSSPACEELVESSPDPSFDSAPYYSLHRLLCFLLHSVLT